MLNTISSRATFYDLTGYLMPGILSFGVAFLWLSAVGPVTLSVLMCTISEMNWAVFSILLISLGYVTGHCANSLSSWIIEATLFKQKFLEAKAWQKRLEQESPARWECAKKIANKEFNIPPTELRTFDLLIRLQERYPSAAISGFSFLCIYGMSRTLALLSWIAAVPFAILTARYCGDTIWQKVILWVISCTMMCGVGVLFLHQYLRFVKYYHDFLASTLVVKTEK